MSIQESRARLAEAFQAYQKSQPDNREMAIMLFRESKAGYHAACADLVERLPAILAPFAEEAKGWHAVCLDHWRPVIGTQPGDDNVAAFTIGDLRALGALYEEVKDAKG